MASAAALLPPFGRPRGLGIASRQVFALCGCFRQFVQGLPLSHLMWERLQLAQAITGTTEPIISPKSASTGEDKMDGEAEGEGVLEEVGDDDNREDATTRDD